jgi:hypothetical protein
VVDVLEFDRLTGNVTNGASFTLDAAPTTGDVLLVGATSYATTNITAVSGCGATWTEVNNTLAPTGTESSASVWIGRGATSAGTITLTTPTTLRGHAYMALVRGLSSDVVTANDATTGTTATLAGPTHSVGPDQIAFVCWTSDSSATAWSTTQPASGWTLQAPYWRGTYNNQGSEGWHAPTATEPHSVSLTDTSGGAAIIQVVVGGGAPAPTVGNLVAALPAITATLSGSYTAPVVAPVVGHLGMTLPGVTVSLSGSYVAPVVTTPVGNLAASLPAVTAALSGAYVAPAGAIPVGTLAATLPAFTASLSGTYTLGFTDSSDTFDNDGYNYTGTSRVFYEAPIAEPPPTIVREKVKRVHQSLPAPTVVNGRPTW